MQLLERSDILESLVLAVERAASGSGRLVCIVGEAGVGKSSVARKLAEHVEGRVRVFWGACDDLSTPVPLAPLYDFARIGGWPLPETSDLARRLSSFSSALSELSSAPTLAVIEDVHWADDATADFVRYIARRIASAPVLLVATARNDTIEAQNCLRRALADVPPEDIYRIELARLSEVAVREVAAAQGRDGAALYSLTSGNPFLTMEVLRSTESVPATVRDALLWRADKLGGEARWALNAASVFPRRVERLALRAMCGDAAELAIAECLGAGLLVEQDAHYTFRHEIARCAIEAALLPVERSMLNGRALRVLADMGAIAKARLVHHAIEANDVEAICDLAPRAAAEAAESGAHREASKHYAAALEHASRFDQARRADLFERAGYELQLIGRVGDAISSFDAASGLRRNLGDAVACGNDLRWLARLHYNIGDRVAADRLGKEAIELLRPAGPSYELAMAYANLALLTALRDESAAAGELANAALELGHSLGLEEIVADAHGTLGITKQWVDASAAHAHFDQGLLLALALNKPELVARIYNNGGAVRLNTRAHASAKDWLERGLAYCAERDLLTWVSYMRGLLAELLVREGQWDAARNLAERTLEGDLSPVFRFPASNALARLRIRTGEKVDVLFANLTFDNEPQRLLAYAPIFGEYAWTSQCDIPEALETLQLAAPVAAAIGNAWAGGEIAYWRYKLGDLAPQPSHTFARPYRLMFCSDWRGAANAWRELGSPFEAALSLLEGDEKACDEALRTLDSLGAIATASRARKELRERGIRYRRGPRSTTQRNRAGLTTREMEVLELLGQGRSNAAIARRLKTAVKTIDHHVSAILGKLGVNSRGEAVARARSMGLIP